MLACIGHKQPGVSQHPLLSRQLNADHKFTTAPLAGRCAEPCGPGPPVVLLKRKKTERYTFGFNLTVKVRSVGRVTDAQKVAGRRSVALVTDALCKKRVGDSVQ